MSCHAQDKSLDKSIHIFDGYVVGAFLDGGGNLNFMRPNFNLKWNKNTLVFGMLPSLRLNRLSENNRLHLFPTLGAGITYSYKNIAFQIPFYYNFNSDLQQVNWNVGIGIGYYFNYSNNNS